MLDGVPEHRGKRRFGCRSTSQIAKRSVICCHLANTNEELRGLATAIPSFAKLLWSLFVCIRVCIQSESARITGGLSGELHVTKATGQTFEETLTWSVDSQVMVEPRTKTSAALMIREEEMVADLTIESTIRPLYVFHLQRATRS